MKHVCLMLLAVLLALVAGQMAAAQATMQSDGEEAARVFDRMLWLNPSDNQGVRGLIDDVRTGIKWEDG